MVIRDSHRNSKGAQSFSANTPSFSTYRCQELLDATCRDFPVYRHREEIFQAIDRHSVTILTSDTGTGKSTYLPTALALRGESIVVTEPRVVAAQTAAERVASVVNQPLGNFVAFHTAEHRKGDIQVAKLLYCTDGVAMIDMLQRGGCQRNIFMIDEAHELNVSIEIMLGYVVAQIQNGIRVKLIISSATIDPKAFIDFVASAGLAVAHVHIPGRVFQITDEKPDTDIESSAIRLYKAGHGVLIIQPGKREIASCINELKRRGLNAPIFPLHAELSAADEAKALNSSNAPRIIVASSYVETGITIPGITAVVDSGRVRVSNIINGRHYWDEGWAPLDVRDQRRGRAGRQGPGVFVDFCRLPDSRRAKTSLPKILSTDVAKSYLQLATTGIHLDELRLLNQPSKEHILAAKNTLRALGCVDESGDIQPRGWEVVQLPVDISYAAIIIEAQRLGVVHQAIALVVVMEVGGIISTGHAGHSFKRTDSDILSELEVFTAHLKAETAVQYLSQLGVSEVLFEEANRRRSLIYQRLKLEPQIVEVTDENAVHLRQAICAGMILTLARLTSYGEKNLYVSLDGQRWPLNGGSGLQLPEWIVGLQVTRRIEDLNMTPTTIKYLKFATEIEPSWIIQYGAHLLDRDSRRFVYLPENDSFALRRTITCGMGCLPVDVVATPPHDQAAKAFSRWMAEAIVLQEPLNISNQRAADVINTLRVRTNLGHELNIRSGEARFLGLNVDKVEMILRETLKGACSISAIVGRNDDLLPSPQQSDLDEIITNSPLKISVRGFSLSLLYGVDRPPIAAISQNLSTNKTWCRFPDSSVTLPNRRSCLLLARVGPYTVVANDGAELKGAIFDAMQDLKSMRWSTKTDPGIESFLREKGLSQCSSVRYLNGRYVILVYGDLGVAAQLPELSRQLFDRTPPPFRLVIDGSGFAMGRLALEELPSAHDYSIEYKEPSRFIITTPLPINEELLSAAIKIQRRTACSVKFEQGGIPHRNLILSAGRSDLKPTAWSVELAGLEVLNMFHAAKIKAITKTRPYGLLVSTTTSDSSFLENLLTPFCKNSAFAIHVRLGVRLP